MFKKIRLKNYRTHADTQLSLGPVTLLIGNNNSGKTNFLEGVRHFSRLVAYAAGPDEKEGDGVSEDFRQPGRDILKSADLIPHRNRFSDKNEPITFSCTWTGNHGEVEYSVDLIEDMKVRNGVACREKIDIRENHSADWHKIESGWEKPADRLLLRRKVENSSEENIKVICRHFFQDMAQAFSYHFQPSYLKGKVSQDDPKVTPECLSIPSQLGYEGLNLQEILLYAGKADERAYQRFLAALRRFEPTFHGIRKHSKEKRTVWEFDLKVEKAGRLEEFPPEVISDGLMKAAAIALLTTLHHPPALILIEEIENGINPGNINQFLGWLWQCAGLPDEDERGYATQFVLTSHSPSVLREFADHPEYVYTVRLARPRLKSDVRNLRDFLDMLIGVGTVEGEIDEEDGRRIIRMPKFQIAELWYNGTIG